MEVEDVLLREEESEEELDASLSLPPTLTREQPFVTPPLQHRRTHIFLVRLFRFVDFFAELIAKVVETNVLPLFSCLLGPFI